MWFTFQNYVFVVKCRGPVAKFLRTTAKFLLCAVSVVGKGLLVVVNTSPSSIPE